MDDCFCDPRTSSLGIVTFSGPEKFLLSSSKASLAKAYVLSLMANDDVTVEETTERLAEEHFSRLAQDHEQIQRDSNALLILNPNDRTVCIQGPRPNVLLAQAMLHQKLVSTGSVGGGTLGASTSTSGQPQHHLVVAVKSTSSEEDERLGVYGTGLTQSFSPGAESSHDSCYDSDGSPSASRRSSYARPGASHDDVSRTVSDTLAAERLDDEPGSLGVRAPGSAGSRHKLLTPASSLPASLPASKTSPPKIPSKSASETHLQHSDDGRTSGEAREGGLGQCGNASKLSLERTSTQGTGGFSVESQEDKVSSPETDSSEEYAQSAAYTPKVEFALKLGYSEEQLREVLHKCGRDLSQNELLSELIKLGSNPDHAGKYTMSEASQEGVDSETSDAFQTELVGDNSFSAEEQTFTVEHSQTAKSGSIAVSEETEDAGNAFLTALIGSAKSQEQKSSSASESGKEESNLRYIVIDGSNLAMSHGGKEVFSCVGIKLAVDWFRLRGHKQITVFVPQWRKETPRIETPIRDQEVLFELERDKVLVFTPARRVQGKRVVCYDDRYIIKLAAETDGIVVSNDHYKDLVNENHDFKKVIEERLLMYSFVDDRFMPPDDPLGRHGPSLDNFLLKEPTVPEPLPPTCPYAKKCTYGNKCKFYHPERGSQPHKSVTEKLAEVAKVKIQEVKDRPMPKRTLSKTQSVQLPGSKTPLSRTKSLTPAITVTTAPNTGAQMTAVQDSGAGGHARLSKAASSSCFTIGGKEEIKVTLATDEKWKVYDNKLSEFRKKIEASEKENERRRVDAALSPRGQDADTASLQPPLHWSQQSGHESLRHTHSDPPSMHYPDTPATLSGHLALAKTLSDEGKKQHHEMQGHQQQHTARPQSRSTKTGAVPHQQEQIRQKCPKGRKVSPHNQGQPDSNQHRKLQRQLSLKGAEDPRVQQHIYRDGRQIQRPPVQFPHPQLQARQSAPPITNKPSFRFGHEGPNNPHIRIAGQHSWNFPGDPTIPPGWQQETTPKTLMMQKDKAPLTRHASFGPGHPSMHALQREHGQAHAPLGRMSSAPGTYFNKVQDQEEKLGIPRMTRQNSTSDPQLHAHLAEDQMNMGVPFESYAAGNQDSLPGMQWSQAGDAGSFEDIINPMSDMYLDQQRGRVPPFTMQPPRGYNTDQQARNQSGQLDANQDRLTPPNVPFGHQGPVSQTFVQFGSNQIKIPIEDAPIYDPSVPPPALTHPPPTGHLPMHTPPRTASPVRKNSPLSMSPAHQALRQQRSGAHGTGDQYRLSPPPPTSAPPDPTSGFNLSSFSYGQLPMGSIGGGFRGNSEHGSREHIPAVIGTGRLMTPPLVQGSGSDIVSPDTRDSIFFHLSGLFPEDKVQAVMKAFPNETNPKVLCAHLIKMT